MPPPAMILPAYEGAGWPESADIDNAKGCTNGTDTRKIFCAAEKAVIRRTARDTQNEYDDNFIFDFNTIGSN